MSSCTIMRERGRAYPIMSIQMRRTVTLMGHIIQSLTLVFVVLMWTIKRAWYSNCSVTHEQSPDCGIRCSISKTRDAVTYGRYQRYARMFDVVPVQGLRTIHSDAWRDVGASWEPNHFISMESEQFFGQDGDSNFWKGHQDDRLDC